MTGTGTAVETPGASDGQSGGRPWLEGLLVFTLALAVRLIEIGHPPDIDELHHVLAAQSLLTDGTLRIADGEPYTRAWGFTLLVAWLFHLFGASLVVARIPAVLAGAALVAVLFLWVRSVSGRTAAWASAVLLFFYPPALFYSQLCRFYTLQALLFWGGAVAFYRLLSPPKPKLRSRVALATVGSLSLTLALHLQVITAVGIMGLAGWAALVTGPALLKRSRVERRWFWTSVALTLLGLLAVWALIRSGAASQALALFRYADYWAASNRDSVRFYHWRLLEHFGMLWPLFPVALLVAASARPRPATFCGLIFGVAFVFHSLAAWKHERYLLYAMPMFFAVLGMAIAELIPLARHKVEALLARSLGWRAPGRLRTVAAGGVLSVVALATAAGNGAFSTTFRMLLPSDPAESYRRPFRGYSNWDAAVGQLRSVADSSMVVVSSSNLKALYYLGRFDFDIEAQRLYTADGWLPEFSVFRQTGRPAISTPASLALVIGCYPTGLIVVENSQWRQPWGVPPAVADFVAENTDTVFVSEPWQLMAFRWQNPVAARRAACPPLRAAPYLGAQ